MITKDYETRAGVFMSPTRARFALVVVFALITGVAFNAMFLQDELAPLKNTKRSASLGDGSLRSQPRTTGVLNPVRQMTAQDARKTLAASSPQLLRQAAQLLSRSNADRNVVAGIQRELSERGYNPGPVDGIAGIKTRAAVMALEYDERLVLTADPSADLLKRLIFGAPSGTQVALSEEPKSDEARSIILSVQGALSKLGYGPLSGTGRLDGATRSAIRSFERNLKMVVSGRISGNLVAHLSRAKSPRINLVRADR